MKMCEQILIGTAPQYNSKFQNFRAPIQFKRSHFQKESAKIIDAEMLTAAINNALTINNSMVANEINQLERKHNLLTHLSLSRFEVIVKQ